ncbi:MAG: DUF4416 family protein [Spirochaetes bacterium]|nr:DUF4416 family protein [Spirochaetota bacterium]
MAPVHRFSREKLLIAIIAAPAALACAPPDGEGEGGRSVLEDCLSECGSRFGPQDFRSAALPFDYTDYYAPEMGLDLMRLFVSFETLVDPGELSAIKRWTNELEERRSKGGRRLINLDPGLMALSRFVLATTKNRGQRIPLSDGIYAELTLLYGSGAWQPLPWTYPDYATPEYSAILSEIRRRSGEALKREERSRT